MATTDVLGELAVRQIDSALKFYGDQMPAYAASAGLSQEEFAAVMADVHAVRKFFNDATIRSLLAAVRERDELREALREYMDHDLGGVHVTPEHEGDAGYESCEHIHHRFGPLAFPEKAAEYAALHREDGA